MKLTDSKIEWIKSKMKLYCDILEVDYPNIITTRKVYEEFKKYLRKQTVYKRVGRSNYLGVCHSREKVIVLDVKHSTDLKDLDNNITLALDCSKPQDAAQISKLIRNLDIEYFNAIRNHIEEQRKKYAFFSETQTSTPHEIAAGAPESWTAELTFIGSNFLPEQNSKI